MNADIEELKQKLAEIDEALEEYGKLLEEKDELEELQDIMTDVIVDQGKGLLIPYLMYWKRDSRKAMRQKT